MTSHESPQINPPSRSERRLGALAVLSCLGALAGCDAGPTEGQRAGAEPVQHAPSALYNQSVTFEVVDTGDIANDGYEFPSSTEREEHCYVSADLQTDFPAGTQIRIAAGSHLGLCTVRHNANGGPTCGADAGTCYRIAVHADLATNRLGLSSPSIGTTTSGTASNQYDATHNGVAEHKSWPTGSFSTSGLSAGVYEYVDAPTSPVVVYTAPHGNIETGVNDQVDFIIEDADADNRNAGWVVQYKQSGGGTNFDHFHITSGDISEDSFPDLDTLFGKTSLRYAVSFHGFSESSYTFDDAPTAPATCDSVTNKCTHVLVGGDEDLLFRKGVAELLNEVLPSDKRARAEGFSSSLWGMNDDNFVNRLTADHKGLQLEQSSYVRTNHKEAIADTIESVYDCLIDGVDVTRLTTTGTVTSPNADYATTDRCARFIAEIETSSAVTSFNAGRYHTGSCPGSGSAHVDYYRWNTTLTRWIRIGGGHIDYDGSCAATEVDFTQPSVTDRAAGLFRAVVRATTGSSPGTQQRAFFTAN